MARFHSYVPNLRAAARAIRPLRVLEWGPGDSTRVLAHECAGAQIVSIEHDPEWFETARRGLKDLPNVELVLLSQSKEPGRSQGYASYPLRRRVETGNTQPYDLVFVDGRSRVDCLVTAYHVVADDGIVILHDAERPAYEPGWRLFPHIHGNPAAGTIALSRRPEPLQRYAHELLDARWPRPEKLGALQLPITICVLLYGDFPHLAERCLRSIYDQLPADQFELRLGLNAISAKTRRWLDQQILPHGNVVTFESATNIFKYPMMRRMFFDPPLRTEWLIWLDDDSHVTSPSWMEDLAAFFGTGDYDFVGKPYFMCLSPAQLEWVRSAGWYRGRELRLHNRVKPKADFMTGGFWLARSKVIEALDWPDPRLRNNGGDVMLGEAMHQAGYRAGSFWRGIAISDAPRRGASHPHPEA